MVGGWGGRSRGLALEEFRVFFCGDFGVSLASFRVWVFSVLGS